MRYVGGKAQIARWVAEHLAPLAARNSSYLEPFMGSGATLAKMAPLFGTVQAGDAHADLVMMWRALCRGWVPPDFVSRDFYEALRHTAPSPVRGFVGYGASFGGKWFGGYVDRANDTRPGRRPVHFAEAAARAVLRDADAFRHAEIRHCDFTAWAPRPGTLVYCDPPYRDRTGYEAVGAFDSDRFWSVAQSWAARGVDVVVSELVAPEGWTVLSERQKARSLNGNRGGAAVERLFTYCAEGVPE